jgi:hypothetical protein
LTLTQNLSEVPCCAPHRLHKGLLVSPIKQRRLLRVLCPLRRPVNTLDCVPLKDRSLVFATGLGLEINFRAFLWVPRHITICWFSTQQFIFLFIFYLETPKPGSGPTHWWTALSLVSWSAILFPRSPESPGTGTLKG